MACGICMASVGKNNLGKLRLPPAASYTCQESVQTGLQEQFGIPVCVLGLELLTQTQSHCLSKVFSCITRHSAERCVCKPCTQSPICAWAGGASRS